MGRLAERGHQKEEGEDKARKQKGSNHATAKFLRLCCANKRTNYKKGKGNTVVKLASYL